MSQTAVGREQVEERFEAIRSVLRRERRRTTDERRAFRAFAEQVSELQPTAGPASGTGSVEAGGGTVVTAEMWPPTTPQSVADLDAVRRAYKETVMDVSFYEAEYGDDYEASVTSELGSEVALAVTEPDCFTPAAKRALLASVERATRERTVLVETCKRERAAVDDAADALLPLAEELDSLAATLFDHMGFGGLDAARNRLLSIEADCETAATTRQRTIHRQRDRHSLPTDEPDICAYLYKDLDATYPILALCTDLADRASDLRRHTERAMSGRS
ncbi:MAG: hypothetical protein ABEH90_02690 [Halolamina sp.]